MAAMIKKNKNAVPHVDKQCVLEKSVILIVDIW
jgi:hypothetical protein